MRYCILDQIEQGDKLGLPIFTSDGRTLLEEGVVLSIGLISRLKRLGVNAVYLQDERLDDIEIEEVVSDTTKREVVKTISESVQYIQAGSKEFDLKGVSKATSKIIDEVLVNQKILVNLTDIRTSDNALFIHSTNVCIMSIIIGIKLGLRISELHDLALGALFHDIGKIIEDKENAVPTKEDGDPNDHTWKGFNFLRQRHEINTVTAHIALQHHEHIDGSGYPRKIKGDKIPHLAKIVAVVNYYDNLISPQNGLDPLAPHEACERILGLTNIAFDHEIVWQFLRSVAFYPTGRQVKLSTGETGIISKQNNGLPQRPIVRVFEFDDKSKFEDYHAKEVDLGKETTIFIDKVL